MLYPQNLNCTSEAFALLSADLLKNGKTICFQAYGGSMRPLIHDGDILYVNPINSDKIQIGDVVFFINDREKAIVHRVIKRDLIQFDTYFTIQGDRAIYPDGRIAQSNVLGKLVQLDRSGKEINMEKPTVLILNRLAAVKTRYQLGKGKAGRFLIKVSRNLGFFANYLN